MITVTIDDHELQLMNTSWFKRFNPIKRERFFHERVSPYLSQQFSHAFAVRGRKTKWRPLSKVTIQDRLNRSQLNVKGDAFSPLIRTSQLFDFVSSFRGQTMSSEAETSFAIPGFDEVGSGGDAPALNPPGKYKWHQTGFAHKSGQKVPARPMVEWTEEDVVVIQNMALEYFLGGK